MEENQALKQTYPPGYMPDYSSDEFVCLRAVVRLDMTFFAILESRMGRQITIVRISEPEYRFLRRIGIAEVTVM
ncbi:MAG: hypothetical protein HPY52_00860 [Firmicutes bacterium]|nr:hypothetical protein [Bacillota bacterium]